MERQSWLPAESSRSCVERLPSWNVPQSYKLLDCSYDDHVASSSVGSRVGEVCPASPYLQRLFSPMKDHLDFLQYDLDYINATSIGHTALQRRINSSRTKVESPLSKISTTSNLITVGFTKVPLQDLVDEESRRLELELALQENASPQELREALGGQQHASHSLSCSQSVKSVCFEKSPDELEEKGKRAFLEQRYSDAVELFTEAIRYDPLNHKLFSNRSACFAAAGHLTQALRDGEECVRLNADFARGYDRKGLAQFFLGRYDEAELTYQMGLRILPEDVNMMDGLGKTLAAKHSAAQLRKSV